MSNKSNHTSMTNICDHTSVGMIVYKDDKILLIERRKKPFGFAPPAGHIDGDSTFEESAIRELKEEVGLIATKLELLIEGRKENHCRREDGTWHYWKIYRVEAINDIERSKDETKQVNWFSKDQIIKLVERTREYLQGKISDEEWENNPGLEPVWLEWLEELKII